MSRNKQKQFLKLYQAVHPKFEKYCRARAFAELPYEDLVNETLLIAYQKVDRLTHPDSFLSFLIGISRRVLANTRKKKRPSYQDQQALQRAQDPWDQLEEQHRVDFLHQLLSQLPDAHREALILYEITGFSIKEISKIQDSGEAAVKKRLSRGRASLRKLVQTHLNQEVGGTNEGR